MTEEAATSGNELSPTDAAILEMIREGRYDAEIASRLFISTADVKARIERMLAQGGLRERNDFMTPPEPEPTTADDAPPPFERQPRTMPVHNAVLAVVGALAIGVGVGWVVRDEQSGGQATANSSQVDSNPRRLEPVLIFPQYEPTQNAAVAERVATIQAATRTQTAARVATDIGPLFFTSSGVQQTIADLDLDGSNYQTVTLAGTSKIGLVSLDQWAIKRRSTSDAELEVQVRGKYLTLKIETAAGATLIQRDGDVIVIASSDGSNPKVKFRIDGAQWSLGLDGRLVVYL